MKIFALFTNLCKAIVGMTLGVTVVALLFPHLLPLGSPSPSLNALAKKSVIDMHVHVAGFGYGDSNCFVAPELRESIKKHFYLYAFGVSEKELQAHGDAYLVEKLSQNVQQSTYLKEVVVLALDAVHDDNGKIQLEKTQVYVPNEFVRKQSQRFSNIRYGASIHPYRDDALDALQKAKNDGAVLLKWIPSIMHIDPADERLIPFYKALVAHDLPLLTHAGQEKAFSHAIDELSDPKRLALPLSLGVTVIAAHLATTGELDGERMIDRLLPMFERYPNLYADISSLTQINKLAFVEEALLNKDLEERMLYGSDWPLQFFPIVSPWYHAPRLRLADLRAITAEENVFDRDILLKLALGVSPSVFRQTPKLLYED